jgi:acyl-CoA synthetase (AMP-forming)/AMP-acid ligase II
MARRTLLDFFADLERTPGEFLVYDDGYRTRSYTYGEVAQAARDFAATLPGAFDPGRSKPHAVVIWAENRPEWIVAQWG